MRQNAPARCWVWLGRFQAPRVRMLPFLRYAARHDAFETAKQPSFSFQSLRTLEAGSRSKISNKCLERNIERPHGKHDAYSTTMNPGDYFRIIYMSLLASKCSLPTGTDGCNATSALKVDSGFHLSHKKAKMPPDKSSWVSANRGLMLIRGRNAIFAHDNSIYSTLVL